MTRIVLIIQAIIQDNLSRAFSAVIITSAQHPREGIFLDFFFFGVIRSLRSGTRASGRRWSERGTRGWESVSAIGKGVSQGFA